MPISYPITLPFTTRSAAHVRITKNSAVGRGVSPYSYQTQKQVWSGQRWLASVSLPPMLRADAEPWIAALLKLNGGEGNFLLFDTANKTPRGIGTGTPLVKGAGQTGQDLVTDGWTISQTGILKAGDWVQLGSGSTARLYKLLDDANSNASGEATLTLWPNLRSSPADNAALTINSAAGVFELVSDIEWDIDAAKVYGLQFEAVEAL